MTSKLKYCIQWFKNVAVGAVLLTAILLAACMQPAFPVAETEPPVPESTLQAVAPMEKGTGPLPESAPASAPEKEPIPAEQAEPFLETIEPRSAEKELKQTATPAENEESPEETARQTETDAASGTTTETRPAPAPASEAEPMQQFEPEPAPIPEPVPAPAPAYGAIPFEVAAGTGKWWSIDSSDSAYWAMAEQINAVRAAGGLPALGMDGNLSAIASSRCESFVAGGPFDHSGMVTTSEICAAGPLGSASAACAAWQASETHYANIMRTDITSMGVGCWFCSVDGNNYTYWTVTFG